MMQKYLDGGRVRMNEVMMQYLKALQKTLDI